MTRVLCDASIPLERGSRCPDRARRRPSRHRRRRGRATTSSALLSWEPVTAVDLDAPSATPRHRDAERRLRPRRRRSGDRARCVGVQRPRLLRRRDGRSRARASARPRARCRRARPERARRQRGTTEAAGPLRRAADIRLGVIGFGRIGRALASRAQALGMDVARARSARLRTTRSPRRASRPATLDELLESCTAVSLHAPLTPETRGLLGARELELLPRRRATSSTSRGEGSSTRRHCSARSRAAASAVSRSTCSRSSRPRTTSPAPAAPRLVVTPHAGWYSERAEEAAFAARDRVGARRARGPRGLDDAVNEPLV